MTVAAIHRLHSGGYLVDVGEDFPVWREDMGAVRRLLLERDLATADTDCGASEVVIERFPSFTPGSTPNFAPAPTAAPAA